MQETTWRDVTIAWARPSQSSGFDAADLAGLGEAQLARYRALSGERAAGFLAGRSLIRDLARRNRADADIVLDSRCPRCGGDHVAPRLPGAVISISHAHDLVVVAMSSEVAELGVDVAADADGIRVDQLTPLFTPGARPDLGGWTRLEAVVKADGRGLAIPPGDVRLRRRAAWPSRRVDDAGCTREWSARVPDRAGTLRAATLDGPEGYTLSVAVRRRSTSAAAGR